MAAELPSGPEGSCWERCIYDRKVLLSSAKISVPGCCSARRLQTSADAFDIECMRRSLCLNAGAKPVKHLLQELRCTTLLGCHTIRDACAAGEGGSHSTTEWCVAAHASAKEAALASDQRELSLPSEASIVIGRHNKHAVHSATLSAWTAVHRDGGSCVWGFVLAGRGNLYGSCTLSTHRARRSYPLPLDWGWELRGMQGSSARSATCAAPWRRP